MRSNQSATKFTAPMAIATSSKPGGYDYKFVDSPPDRLVCNICRLPSRDPYLTTCCGHVFCKSCLDDSKKIAAASNICPVCRVKEFVTYINKQADREIRSLYVMCPNKESGCEWQGELNDINNHLGNSDGCQFENVKCSNECGKMLQRQYLTSHVETECPCYKVDCQYCHITGEHQFIEGEHRERCSKFPLPCPNKCEVESVHREDMETHRNKCPLEMVQCEYHNVGCEKRMMRKRKREHEEEKMEEHLLLLKHRLTNSLEEVCLTKAELADTKSQLASAVEEINTLKSLLHQALGHISYSKGTALDPSSLDRSAKRCSQLTMLSMLLKSGRQSCPVVMKIPGYSEKKDNDIRWTSDSFYSHDKGYKMCLHVYPAGNGNGKGKGTHLSVFLYLMKGPHDDELTWPLKEKFEVKLLNQISDYDHHNSIVDYSHDNVSELSSGRVVSGDEAYGLGHKRFISNEYLKVDTYSRRYLKYDCIFLLVSKL
ncbi:TNF receptor-associated factor 4-like [Dysidea avara]|uniref:TNF receptor-associated factor 4-like n=1 Tax=Dysidea avara TaxID=196820 RepID=UPI00332A247A